jgi:hypothetical protein
MSKINEATRRSASQQLERLRNRRAAIIGHEAPPTLTTPARAALSRLNTARVQRISSWIKNISDRSKN